MDAYIAIRGSQNITELSDVPAEQMKLVAKKMRPVQDQRVRKQSGSCCAGPPLDGATRRHEHGSVRGFLLRRVHAGLPTTPARDESAEGVNGKNRSSRNQGTGHGFAIQHQRICAIICGGDRNIPDGEVFSCPVKRFVEGHVTFNAPTIYQGIGFDGIRLEFRRQDCRSDG